MMLVIAFVMPATAFFPTDFGLKYPRTVWSDMGLKGTVTGRVVTSVNGTTGVGCAYIAVVNGSNESQEYWNTTSDAYGNYQIIGLNATYSSALMQGPHGLGGLDYFLGRSMYKVYANKSPYGEGYSDGFGIDTNSSYSTTCVVIVPRPARIELTAERDLIRADGMDNITVTATMYDVLGNPAADGYPINFTVGNATNNSFMGYGEFAYPLNLATGKGFDPRWNGSLDHPDNNANIFENYTRDNTGSTDVQFGWLNENASGNYATIWAYCADDPLVNASIVISIESPASVKYPQTIWSDMGRTGTAVGRVTASVNGTTGIGGAYVAIANASNARQEYYNTTSDAYGNYYISGINATYSSLNVTGPDGTSGTYARGRSMYVIYASKSPYGEGYSDGFGIDADLNYTTTTCVVLFPPEPFAPKYGPLTVWSEAGSAGVAVGRVTTSINGSVGLPGAYVAIVNGSNESQEYCNTTSDENGNYVFTGLNATYNSALLQGPDGTTGSYWIGRSAYKVYANKSPYGEGYSWGFGIDANNSYSTTTSVTIFPRPATIELTAERGHILADGLDNTTITATVYDALGNPAADGYPINFTVGNATSNAWNGGFGWTALDGSLNGASNRDAMNYTSNNIGTARASFGWVPDEAAGNTTYIWAYYADDPEINASLAVSSYAFDESQANAEYVCSNIPDAVMVGQIYGASITFRNTGTMPWTESSLVRMLAWGDTAALGIAGDCDDHGCGYPEFAIAPGTTVLPGQEYTWYFNMTPVTAGYTCIGLIMAHNGEGGSVTGIGNAKFASIPVTPATFDIGLGNAQYLYNTIPSTLVAGDTCNVSVTFTNDGWAPWSEADHVRLLSWGDTAALNITGDCDNYGCGYPEYAINPDSPVLLWQTHTWHFTLHPTSPGTYTVGFAMVQNNGSTGSDIAPFGSYGYAVVNVLPAGSSGSDPSTWDTSLDGWNKWETYHGVGVVSCDGSQLSLRGVATTDTTTLYRYSGITPNDTLEVSVYNSIWSSESWFENGLHIGCDVNGNGLSTNWAGSVYPANIQGTNKSVDWSVDHNRGPITWYLTPHVWYDIKMACNGTHVTTYYKRSVDPAWTLVDSYPIDDDWKGGYIGVSGNFHGAYFKDFQVYPTG